MTGDVATNKQFLVKCKITLNRVKKTNVFSSMLKLIYNSCSCACALRCKYVYTFARNMDDNVKVPRDAFT